MHITGPRVTTQIRDHVKDSAAFPVGEVNNGAYNGNVRMQSEQRQQNEANISYPLPRSNLQAIEGKNFFLHLNVSCAPSSILQKQTVLWDSGHYLSWGSSWVLKKAG